MKITKYLNYLKSNGHSESSADIFSSFKGRIELDLDGFYEIENLKVLDGTRKLDIGQVFELDNFDLFDRYTTGISGRIALKNAGYQVSDAKGIIERVTDEDHKKILQSAVNVLLGKPNIENMTSGVTAGMQVANNIGSSILLVTSPLSLIMEQTMLAVRAVVQPKKAVAILNSIANDFMETGADSFASHELAEMFGFGVGHKMGGTNVRGESFSAFDIDAKGKFGVEQTRLFRDLIMNNRGFGISFYSSLIERQKTVESVQLLMDIAHGKSKVSDIWMTKYGLDEEVLATARKYLTPNDKGFVKKFNLDNAPAKDQFTLHNIIFNMNQYGAQRSTIGGSPQYMYSTALGATFMKLLSYSVNSFSNLGVPTLRGVASGDFDAMLTASAMFFGGYLSGKTRDFVLGRKEKTEEEYINYAFMQMPMFAPLQILKAFTDPTVPAGVTKAGDDVYNFGAMVAGVE